MIHHQRTGEPKGWREPDFARLLDAAHQQLDGPIVLVWDRLPGHISARMRTLTATRTWLRVYCLPGYAPELNPVENVWSNVRRSLANLTPGTVTDLADGAKTRLKRMQYGQDSSTASSPPPGCHRPDLHFRGIRPDPES
jgi:hypothetical protein